MSENYDYPPAPRRLSRGGASSDRDRFQRPSPARTHHLRDLLSSDRNRSSTATTARALETLDQELEEYRSDSGRGQSRFEQIRADLDRQIQQLQSDLSGRGDRIRHLLGDHATVDPFEMNQEPSRPPDTSRQISRPFRRRTTRDSRLPRGPRLRETENSSLLDEPVPPLESPTVMPRDVETDRQMNRRTKRRKLESDDARESVRGFSYGEYGQVVPGVLRMELASCDGGIFEPDGESSFPDNVLRNDASVYCTKSDRCNLILKHMGGAPFCLNRIVIKAPKSGYDSPIQEGMVFVSMASDDLLTRTAQDQAYFSGSRRRRRYRRGLQPSQEYLNSYRSPLQSLHASASDPIAGFRVTTAYDDDFDASQPYQLNDLEQNNNNNSSNDWEESPSFEEIERLHMGQLEDDCSESDESGSDSTSDWDVSTSQFDAFYRHNRTMQSRLRASRRHQQQQQRQQQQQQRQREVMSSFVDPPASATPPPAAAAGSAEIDTFAQQHNGLLKPHAQFYIERAQSMVNIKFDPPPSGRFILIKLWSPHNGGNIDIQSIIAHGFAGPRFFPAGGFR